MNPLVTIVMSVYNGERYLNDAIRSMLNQTYKNFEFIIIDDGSTDNSLKIIEKYKKEDKRIILIKNGINKGLIYSLNKGIDQSKGKYIVRMDADDISFAYRIEKQVEFMEKNYDIAMCGSGMNIFLNNSKLFKIKSQSENNYEKLKAILIFKNSFAHPTMIIRRDILKKEDLKYREEFKYAEDYGLWIEIASKYKVTNMKNILLNYRVLADSITRVANKNINERKIVFKRIFKNYLKILGVNTSDKQLDIHFEISMCSNLKNYQYSLQEKKEYMLFLLNNIKNIDYNYLKEYFNYQFINCSIYQGENINFYNEKIDRTIYLKLKMKFYIKAILKRLF